ncbi:C40 family peptidase [Pseudomonas koreensis]|uniref:C40 family peptidase n=1 Tax=Pseudomonas koreensis TaxID=198620 RepID=UPI001B3450FA|nr:Mov34/MPN/PAD-1 family protein [Pseudomonas koreensis]MBP3999914.1 phage tail protein [Pseudomonas koreensis]
MNKTICAAIERHALAEYPRECCGLVIRENRRQVYVPCRNTATTPSEHFRLAPEDYAAAEDRGEVLAVVHSHPDYPATPSEADRVACEASGLPWHILEVRKGDDEQLVAGELVTTMPEGYQAPLVGRPFHHGILDCLTLVQDFYQREMGIQLPQYEREDDWWNKGQNLYLDLYEGAGFYQVNDLRHGDLILMQIRSPVPNHGAVYLADGILKSEPEHYPAPGSILHHMYGRDSRRDVYGGQWAEYTRMVLRHRDAK